MRMGLGGDCFLVQGGICPQMHHLRTAYAPGVQWLRSHPRLRTGPFKTQSSLRVLLFLYAPLIGTRTGPSINPNKHARPYGGVYMSCNRIYVTGLAFITCRVWPRN